MENDAVIPIEILFQKSELVVTFLIIMLGIGFGNLRIRGVGFGSSGVLIVAMIAGYFYQFEPIPILQDLGIVLFLLSIGLEAGPSFFRAWYSCKAIFTRSESPSHVSARRSAQAMAHPLSSAATQL